MQNEKRGKTYKNKPPQERLPKQQNPKERRRKEKGKEKRKNETKNLNGNHHQLDIRRNSPQIPIKIHPKTNTTRKNNPK